VCSSDLITERFDQALGKLGVQFETRRRHVTGGLIEIEAAAQFVKARLQTVHKVRQPSGSASASGKLSPARPAKNVAKGGRT
jgi:hypothetical protein